MSRTLALFISASLAYGPVAAMAHAQEGQTPQRRGIWVRRAAPTTTAPETVAAPTGNTWQLLIRRALANADGSNVSPTAEPENQGGDTSGTPQPGTPIDTRPDNTTPALVVSPAPSGLAATSAGNGRVVNLTWVDNSTAETTFELTRETKVGGSFGSPVVRSLAPNTTSATDQPGVGEFRYRMRAMDSLGGSTMTEWSSVTVAQVLPSMPTGLQAADMGNARDAWLTWTDSSSNETGFQIVRERRSGTSWVDTVTTTVPANTTSYVDAAGVGTFRYQVRAINSVGASMPTVWLSPTIADIAPAMPTGVATADLANRSQVLVTWSDASGNESGFQIERQTSSGGNWGSSVVLSAGVNAESLMDAPGLGAYRYRVRANNGAGASAYSAWSNVNVAEIAPDSPSNITVADLGNRSQVRVQWADQSDNETGFSITRDTLIGPNAWGSSVTMGVLANVTSMIDSPGMGTYRYRVMATNSAGNSVYTPMVQVSVVEIAPSAPTSLASASANNGSQVNLTWADASNNETSFQITRETQNGGNWGSLVTMNAAANASSMTDAPGVGTFRYRMRAVNTAGNSAYTSYSQVTVVTPAPTAPSSPSGMAGVNNDDGTVTLTWADNANNETGFQIERSPAFSSARTVGANVTTLVDASGEGAFMYRVRAVNGGGNSSWSSWASVTVTDTPPGGTGGTGGTGTGGSGGGGGGGAETGWTTYALASDAREVYVSSSAGNNANDGSANAPVRSIAAGYALLRHGYPDRLKLKRGDTWDEALPSWKKGGRSESQPMVVEAYGDESLDRPLLRTGTASGFRREPGGGAPGSVDNLAIMNLSFWAHTATNSADTGFWWLGSGQNIRIEDCKFANYGFGMTLQGYTGTLTNFKIHRSTIVDSHSNGSHSSGIYASKYDGFEMTECILDKNGWKAGTAANPTIFNHNAYFDILGDGLVFSRNVVTDASSHGVQLRPGATAEDNLFMRNPIALHVGFGGTDAGADDNPQHDQFAYVRRNVFLDGRDIDANNPRGWAIVAEWLRGGEIVDNLALNNNGGYRKDLIVSDTGGGSSTGGVQNVTIARNIWHNWKGDIQFDGNSTELRNVTFANNIISDTVAISPLFIHEFSTTTAMVSANNNVVWTGANQSGWGEIAGSSRSFTQWKSAVGDTTSTAQQATFPNANVTFASYLTASAIGSNYDSFIARAREQRKGNWDTRYEADDIGTWFRAQFGR